MSDPVPGGSPVGPDDLWLAIAPIWTEGAASATGFPAEGSALDALVTGAVTAGHAERRSSWDENDELTTTFWARPSYRAELVERMASSAGLDLGWQTAREIAARVRQADVDVPAQLERWARLVSASDEGPPDGSVVLDQVRELVGLGAGATRTGVEPSVDEALDVLAAAEALVPLADGAFPSAVQRARRLVHLRQRRDHDDSLLRDFIAPADVIDTLHQFLNSDADTPLWALHLIGVGGAGKTMLMRYLTGGAFADDANMENHFPVARVDFDRMSPAYPAERPLELLLALADELEPWADDPLSGRMLQLFRGRASTAHAEGVVGEAGISEATHAFAQFIAELPQPVVLVLDTCEELAKYQPIGGDVPHAHLGPVERTFQVLGKIHEQHPQVRVLFAGRRYLASSGAGWTPEPGASAAVANLPARPYLALEHVRGLDRPAAIRYLRSTVETSAWPGDLVEQILQRSASVGARPRSKPGERFSPLLLSFYRQWLITSGDAAALATAPRNAYFTLRVVRRIKDPRILEVLPALALLGRFDEELLRPVCPDPVAVCALLAQEEWVETALVDDVRILTVTESVMPGLRAWAYAPDQDAATERARVQLATSTRRRLLDGDLADVTAEVAAAAVRVAEHPALLWWDFDERIATDGGEPHWDLAANVVDRVLGELAHREDDLELQGGRAGHDGDEPAFDVDPLTEAAIRATFAATFARQGADPLPQWLEVKRLLGVDPDRPVLPASVEAAWNEEERVLAERLRARARLHGAFAIWDDHGLPPDLDFHLTTDAARVPDTAMALIERFIGAHPRSREAFARMRPGRTAPFAWLDEAHPTVVAAAFVTNDWEASEPPADLRRSWAAATAAQPRARSWADWPQQDHRDPRLLLAVYVLTHCAPGVADSTFGPEVPALIRSAVGQLPELDADHFLAAVLESCYGGDRPEREDPQLLLLGLLDERERARPHAPSGFATWHEAPIVRPLWVARPWALLRYGRVADAQGALLSVRSDAREVGDHRAADRAGEEFLALSLRLRRDPTHGLLTGTDRGELLRAATQLLVIDARARGVDAGSTMRLPMLEWCSVDAQRHDPVARESLRHLSETRLGADPILAFQAEVCSVLARERAGIAGVPDDLDRLEHRYDGFRARAGGDLPTFEMISDGSADLLGSVWEGWLVRTSTAVRFLQGKKPRIPGRGLELDHSPPPRRPMRYVIPLALTFGVLVASLFLTGRTGLGYLALGVVGLGGAFVLALTAAGGPLTNVAGLRWTVTGGDGDDGRRVVLRADLVPFDDVIGRAFAAYVVAMSRLLAAPRWLFNRSTPEIDPDEPIDLAAPTRLRSSRWKEEPLVCLAVEEPEASWDWEHLIAAELQQRTTEGVSTCVRLPAFRTVADADLSGKDWRRRSGVMALAHERWIPSGHEVTKLLDPLVPPRGQRWIGQHDAAVSARVLHITGTVIETPGSPLLQIDGSPRGSAASDASDAWTDQPIWAADEVPGGAALTVLQIQPYEGGLARRLPEEADLVRRFALDLTAVGEQRLLVIPPVPASLHAEIGGEIQRVADASQAPTAASLIKLSRRIRLLILELDGGSAQSLDVALDVLLFI